MPPNLKTLKKIFFFLAPVEVLVLVLLLIQFVDRQWTCQLPPLKDVSCHFFKSPVFLAPFIGPDNETVKIESSRIVKNIHLHGRSFVKNVYFHETSCGGGLTLHQACAVEAASRVRSSWRIYVLFSAPMKKNSVIDVLLTLPNVKFRRLYIEAHVKGTPIEILLRSGRFNRTHCTYSQAADLLSFATLFKYPGLYLDLDMLVTPRLVYLGSNYAMREDEELSAGILDLSDNEVGRSLAKEAAEEMASSFTHEKERNAADVLADVLKRHCNTSDISKMNKKRCKGFSVYAPESLSRLDDSSFYDFETLVFHWYEQHSRCSSSSGDESYVALARGLCPAVFRNNPDEFTTENYLDY